jgi:hAT family C-terminal dimerisation region
MDSTPIYFIASILDPRLKGTWIEAHHPNGKKMIENVRTILYKQYPQNSPSTESTTTNSTFKPSIGFRMLHDMHKNATPTSDIDRYLDSPVVEWDGKKDDKNWVLKWWKANTLQYPIMSQVARDYLAISIAEVDVERLFSSGRDLIGLRRHSLSPDTMKALMLCRDQYRLGW